MKNADKIISVSVVMGSSSDWETMVHAVKILKNFSISCTYQVLSAHRMPDEMFYFAETTSAHIIIAGAGGAAHLPGMIASKTTIPVLGVPIKSDSVQGLDSLLSISQMPPGVPVATFSIGKAGAINAALFAIRLLSLTDKRLKQKLEDFYKEQNQKARDSHLDPLLLS